MKHIKTYENSDLHYLLIVTIYEKYDQYKYIFDKENVMFDFLINYIYDIFKKHVQDEEDLTLEDYLEELDDCQTANQLVEYYNETIHENEIFEGSIQIEETSVIKDKIIVADWIKMRRDAKKYNL